MPVHDLMCSTCGEAVNDFFLPLPWPDEIKHFEDGGVFKIQWSLRSSHHPTWHPSSAITVYENPQTGDVVYPGRNDVPMPMRYIEQGYDKREMRSLREVTRFEKAHGVVNESVNWDKNGRVDSHSDE